MWKTTGRQPPQLAAQPELPEACRYLWYWYLDLKTDSCITYTELAHWAQLKRIELQTFEVEALMGLDRVHNKVIHDRCKSSSAKG